MKNLRWPVCGILLSMCGVLPAQQGTLSGPVAGFVFDHSGRVMRPVRGVPGASLLGDAVSFGMDVSAVYVSPRQDSAVVIGNDESLHLFALTNGTPSEVSLNGLAGLPDQVIFSPSGSSVALVSPGSARILTGLPNAPVLTGSVRVAGQAFQMTTGARNSMSFVPSLALTDDGAYMLTVAQGSVRLLSPQGQNRILMPAQASSRVAFAGGGHDAAVMDPGAGLTLIRDASGAAGTQLVAAVDDNLAGPVGVAFSQDNQTIYVASSKAQSVAAFNIASAGRTAIACGCTPSTLVPMGNLFRLTELTSGPLWLLDGTAANPRTVFVPARSE